MLRNVKIALESIVANKFRAFLTTLGILFGVAAVITMLSIGRGAQQQILEQLELVGVNNIIVQSIHEEDGEEEEEEAESGNEMNVSPYSPGLNLLDHKNIRSVLPNIKYISSEVAYDCYAYSKELRKKTKAIGVHSDYFEIFGVKLEKGSFFGDFHNMHKKNVCVLGSKLAKQLYPHGSALNETIRIGNLNLKVIGILKNQSGIDENLQSLGINGSNEDIYLPIQTLVLRYKNRSKVETFDRWSWNDETDNNKNQLDKIVIQMNNSNYVESSAKVLTKMIKRRHNEQEDFKITIPEQILKQQKETDDIFNWLLGAIAGISLLVGGIGIMNIMLASVMERIREIGLRKSIGAKTTDIKQQFILEASFLSLGGGILGIVLGVSLSYIIELGLEMPTEISTFSILLSFIISVLIGVIFGYIPAKNAAEQDPLTSLKHD
jgi:putative ABC transport system permease protein